MKAFLACWLVGASLTLGACDRLPSDPAPVAPAPVSVVPTKPASPAPVASIEVTPVFTTIRAGDPLVLSATLRDSAGRELDDDASQGVVRRVDWTLGDSSTTRLTVVNGRSALVSGSGKAVSIIATAGGLSVPSVLSIVPSFDAPVPLTILDFRILAFRYPDYPTVYYAPTVRVLEASGVRTAIVTSVRFMAPAAIAGTLCSGGRQVQRGQAVELFPDSYGDYDFYWELPTRVPLGTLATAAITVQYDNLGTDTISVSGPIIAGSLPTTYNVSTNGSLTCAP